MEGALKIEALLSGKWSQSEGGGEPDVHHLKNREPAWHWQRGLVADGPRGVWSSGTIFDWSSVFSSLKITSPWRSLHFALCPSQKKKRRHPTSSRELKIGVWKQVSTFSEMAGLLFWVLGLTFSHPLSFLFESTVVSQRNYRYEHPITLFLGIVSAFPEFLEILIFARICSISKNLAGVSIEIVC